LIDPNYAINTKAEEEVLQPTDNLLNKVTWQILRLAQHRGSKTLDVQDLQIVLAKHWGIVVPGLGLPNICPLKPHKQTVFRQPVVWQKVSKAVNARDRTLQWSWFK
jgi:transcription initiation factor TFIID subunit 12